ncbi:Methionine--tRNA ligase [Candidatus Xenohaliotis californiensis]|uniref:Methionine--tRNA ligase n=1 Tax=Candidatus Xenohaliotis californiensis TaxID=84677 RepID=A0ABM9N6U0_9RICK|nr:Methionine--tRNA ligase [Candidatus Xenohaliotis californiensis]
MISKYYTTPIFYVNDKPHIGHAYTTILCDFFARFSRLNGDNVFFSTGTDEHGQKIFEAAAKRGEETIDYVNEVSQLFFDMGKNLLATHNVFTRTTSEAHKNVALKIWQLIENNGYIYPDKYSGWYAVRDEAFYTELEIENGRSIASGAEVSWVEEPAYFFKLSTMTDKLLGFYDDNPNFILPQTRYNEVKSFVKQGLHDISISRSKVSWGIHLPNDKNQTIYVWLDALGSYLTSLGFASENNAKYLEFWDNDKCSMEHVVGKDILRFHAVYWPAFLMAADLPVPKKIIAHGWWTNEGQKISKSLGNTIDVTKLINDFGTEYVRYFLLREMHIGNDGNFSSENFINRINSELADNIGNLVQRTLSMAEIYNIEFSDLDIDNTFILKVYEIAETAINTMISSYDTPLYIKQILLIASIGNSYITKMEPWNLAKKQQNQELIKVLTSTLELIKTIAIMLLPIIPNSASKILNLLCIAEDRHNFASITYKIKNCKIKSPSKPIFPKIVI